MHMRTLNSLQAIILLILIVLSSELSIMYFIEYTDLNAVVGNTVLNSMDAILLTFIATVASYYLFVAPLRRTMQKMLS